MTSVKKFSKRARDVLKGISAPIATSGSIVLDEEPILTLKESGNNFTIKPAEKDKDDYKHNSPSKLLNQEKMLKELTDKIPKATFGHGQVTKQDTSVRDALQLKAEDFETNIPDGKLEEIMSDIKKGLQLETDIILEPYSLNVYKKGGKFVKHKDTPRGDDMIGTLVVCLPSLFRGGDFKISMGKEIQKHLVCPKSSWARYEASQGGCYQWWSDKSDGRNLVWAAFFADVDHEIYTVEGGVRITLAYLIRRADSQSVVMPREIKENEQAVILKDMIQESLEDEEFMEDGGKIGFPCLHLYTNTEVFPNGKDSNKPLTQKQISKLKGRDLIVANAATTCSLKVYLVPYLSHSCQGCDSDFRLSKFPKKKRCPRFMSDQDIATFFGGWRENEEDDMDEKNHPRNQADLWILEYGDDEQAENKVGECDNYNYEGYYGNEAGYTSFYVKAALHIEIPYAYERQDMVKSKRAKTE